MYLNDGATFITPLIKLATTRVNQNINFRRDTKRHIRYIAINNGWNTQIFQLLREMHDEIFIVKGKFLSRPPKYDELSHECIKKIFKYQEPEFYSGLFDESEN